MYIAPPVPTGNQGRGELGEPWTMSRGLSGGTCPPLCTHNCTPFFHLPCFLQNHLIGGVLISEVRFSSWLLRFALLTSTAQDYLPKSKQNGLTLSRKRRLGRLHYQQICAHVGSAGAGWALQSFSVCPQTDPHSMATENPPILLRCKRVWHSFKKILCIKYVFMCIYMHMHFF